MSDEEGSIEIESGVSLFTGEGFCTVRVDGKMVGQLDPATVRSMAMQWLETAEAAESDALLIRFCRERVGLDDDQAAQMLAQFREMRNG